MRIIRNRFACMKLKVEKKFALQGHKGSVYDLLQSGEHSFYSAGSDQLVVQWNAEVEEDGIVIAHAADSIYSIHVVKESNHLLIGQGSGGVHVVDLNDQKEIKLIQLHAAPVFRISSFENYPFIFSLGGDGILQILNKEYILLKTVSLSSEKLRCIAYDEANHRILVGSGEGVIYVLNAETFAIDERLNAHQEGFGVNAICFSPSGETFLTGSRDAHLNIYNTKDLQLIQSLPAHRAAVYDIQFHHSGKYFATASRDKTVKIWDADTLEVQVRIDKENYDGHSYSVNRCIWMNDLLISSGDDRTIIVNEVTILK